MELRQVQPRWAQWHPLRLLIVSVPACAVMLAVWCLALNATASGTTALYPIPNNRPPQAIEAPAAGPDVIIDSITVDPPIPAVNQQFILTITTRNQGNATTGSFTNTVYLDPVDRPPTQSTAPTFFPYPIFSLVPGVPSLYSFSNDPKLAFSTAGCNHVIYAWADRGNKVVEADETNNIFTKTVCVGMTPVVDTFEPDNTCETARWLTNTVGLAQHHTLNPIGDEDWVKFSTVGGVTYTIEAKNPGPDAIPRLRLRTACNAADQFGAGPSIVWRAPQSGIAFVQVIHRDITYGPLTDYDLSVTFNNSGTYDLYEPDNTCPSARDLPADGSRQTHYFQAQGDVDWVRFQVGGGQTAIVVADSTGPNVSPRVTIYNSCEQAFGQPVADGAQPTFDSSEGGVFYAQVVNQNTGYGPTAFYDLSVTTNGCTGDSSEDDDTVGTAKLVATTGVTLSHNICPAGDADWVKFQAISGTTYVVETSRLGPTADTELFLYDTNGVTELAYNDDYTVGLWDSRIVWTAPRNGTFFVKAQHVKTNTAGPGTRYDFSILAGACLPDAAEGAQGDNTFLNAKPLTLNGAPQSHNFCPQGDQDWVSLTAPVAGTRFTIMTSDLSPGSDTVLSLYSSDGATVLATNDDFGAGQQSLISVTVPLPGVYYVRVVQYNNNNFGSNATYQLSASSSVPPSPTPSPTPWPTPSPTPPPPAVMTGTQTLILVNQERFETQYGTTLVAQLMDKLYQLANHARVEGIVIPVEHSASVAAAYSTWTADQAALLDTTKANNVASAIRNLALSYYESGPSLKYVVIVGDDRIIPFRRTQDWTGKPETFYSATVTISTTQWAAYRDGMSLTDNYYADKIPTTWSKGELYLPDYAVGRLIETPTEIMGFIDAFLASDGLSSNRALITGYDFVQDSASLIKTSFQDDSFTTDSSLIGFTWSADDLRSKQLASVPRFDIQSINGHANHTTELAPPPGGGGISAAEIASSTAGLAGAVIFTVGCHAGLNDSGDLDLAQAFAQKKAYYVANTGFGWGSGGVVYSEALMNYFARLLLLGTSSEIGPTLASAKNRYYNQVSAYGLDAYDDKVLAEATLYGLPMLKITTGATFGEDDPFPSVTLTSTTPGGAFGGLNVGHLVGVLPGSFGAFGQVTDTLGTFFGEGSFFTLNNSTQFSAGQPVQPKFYANVSAPTSGRLHGVLFRGGVYTDVQGFDPVIAQPFNEYVTPAAEPALKAVGFYPPVPFSFNSRPVLSGSVDTLVTLMGQYNSQTSAERLYDHLSFDTYYSADPDMQPPTITYLDAVLNQATGRGTIKLEANDATGIERAVAAFTEGVGHGANGVWSSQDLVYDAATFKWKADITATLNTRYFVQVVDKAGNIQTLHNKGRYYQILPPVGGETHKVFLPLVIKH